LILLLLITLFLCKKNPNINPQSIFLLKKIVNSTLTVSVEFHFWMGILAKFSAITRIAFSPRNTTPTKPSAPPAKSHYQALIPASVACSAKPSGFLPCQCQLSLHIASRPREARQDKNLSANCVSANDTAASPARLFTTSKGIFTLFIFSKVRRTSNTE
jgi:hypothetical protein